MRLKIFTLRYSPRLEKFDDEELYRFLVDKEIVEIRDHFFMYENTPHWAVMALYNSNRNELPRSGGKNSDKSIDKRNSKEDYRELLKDENMPLFNTLRDWRSEKAKSEGVPPYIICTNHQLALMVEKNADSLNALSQIEGFGKSRVEKYGADILGILKRIEKEAEKPENEEAG